MSGWVSVSKTVFDHHLFDGEKFSRRDAWLWLVATACWKERRYNVSGKTISLERGQLCVSLRQLADAWGWSKSSVDRFLTRLKTETMIGTDSGTGKLIITICNYDKFQSSDKETGTAGGTQSGTAAGQQRDTNKQGNKGTSIIPSLRSGNVDPKIDAPDEPDQVELAIQAWKTSAARCGWSIPAKLTPERRKKLKLRLKENGIDFWMDAMRRAETSEMLGTGPPSWWNFDFIIRNSENIQKLMDGNYDKQFSNNSGQRNNDGPANPILRAALDARKQIAGQQAEGRELLELPATSSGTG